MTMETTESAGRFMVVGFDLGHAETAVATVWADSGEEPSIAALHNRMGDSQVHPTAVARYVDPPGSGAFTIVGLRCFDLLAERIAGMPDWIDPGPDMAPGKDMHLGFKNRDIGRIDGRLRDRPVRDAGHTAADRTGLAIRPPEKFIAIPPGTRVHWVFGVPSGWSPATCEAYEALLRRVVTCLDPSYEVEVIPESRAAMLYARSRTSRPQRGVAVQPPDLGSVLVVDMGSLTTDYTYVANSPEAKLREKPLDDGSTQLGAALIEKQLMLRTIDRHRDRDLLERAVHDNNYQHARLEFGCRQAKEQYFSRSGTEPAPGDIALAHARIMTSAGERISVPIRVSSALMDEILDTPIDMPGGNARRSWRDTFDGELAAVRTKILEQYGELPQTVLLTGGASRMPFAGDMCRAAFGIEANDAPGRRLVLSEEPQYVIARGLAIAGRTRHRIDQFLAEAATFTHSRVPALIEENLEPLATALGEVMFTGLVEEQLCPAILRWRSGEFDLLTEIAPDVLRARKEYLEGPEGSVRRYEVIRAWYNQITDVVNQEAQVVANKYEIPAGSFRVRPLNSPEADPDADISVTAGLAALRIIANTAATIMTSLQHTSRQ